MQDKRPNIILVMTDQHRGDCLGIEGHPCLLTPNLDAIAHGGTRFTQAFSTCPICIPARRSLMSGQFPATHGLLGFREGLEWNPPATLPGELSHAGYETFIVGRSMHLHPSRKRYGFDHMVLSGDVHPDDVVEHLPGGPASSWGHGLDPNGWTARPWHLDETLHPSYRTANDAIRFLNRRDPSCPFFLCVNFAGPHPPFYPPAFYMDRYLRQDLPAPTYGTWATAPANAGMGLPINDHTQHLTGEALRSCQAGYYGLINHIDDQIHRFLSPWGGLDPQTAANTVIIFIADHGEMLGDHYLFRKSSPYQGAVRVPFLIKTPSHWQMPTAQTCSSAVCLEDIMPTVLELADVPIPPSVQGQSLVPILKGDPTISRDYVHGEQACPPDDRLCFHYLTDGQHKYIWFTNTGKEQFFDLQNDPNETANLINHSDHEQKVAQWRKRLVIHLQNRPEGFSDGSHLLHGKPCPMLMAHAKG